MQQQGIVGPAATIQSLAPGSAANLRLGQLGDLIASELHARYYESNYRRALFSAATQAAGVTSAGLALAATGLILSNPIGSQVNLVLTKVGFASILAQTTAIAFGIATGFNGGVAVVHTTAGAPSSNFVGLGASGTGMVDTAATLPTAPTVRQILGVVDTGAVTVSTQSGGDLYDLEGSIILPPGAYAQIYTSAASVAASIMASFSWEEIPL